MYRLLSCIHVFSYAVATFNMHSIRDIKPNINFLTRNCTTLNIMVNFTTPKETVFDVYEYMM